MKYPSELTALANKEELLKAYKGVSIESLPTPAFVVDRATFQRNSDKMLENAHNLGADFRAHVKTHKTLEGTALQLGTGKYKTDKIVVSTLREAWGLLPLISKGLIKDILFSLPVVSSRLEELAELGSKVENLRLMVDNLEQLDILAAYSKKHSLSRKWSVFIKINMGTNRAGFLPSSVGELLEKILKTDTTQTVSLYGFYCHAGHSYTSKNFEQAQSFLISEISSVNEACKEALKFDKSLKLQMSVGATPTAHAAEKFDLSTVGQLFGNLELHAGNYPFCDLQQLATGCIEVSDVACKVIAEVVSAYPRRGSKAPGEQLINAGVIALARESGPLPGFGKIVSPPGYENWAVGRLSQEHGILTPVDEKDTKLIPIGTVVSIIPQHSCITAASYPWYYVVEDGNTVVDIWVPYRGW
ncbi:hypothetical protein KL930_004186 [Ogataea haglerorum]|nr:hypothetical protein KL950_000751 [Ogataea haglerorum]KAG7744989.1 hypothetical protein KL932_000019 [Ogataea haglerorum]KAG7774356.1 hypothetical protein KL930_004186 [Ogataea haglerorum]KAG7775644.1 hypothetical protein KL922_004294 [Ogataea haglerorum]